MRLNSQTSLLHNYKYADSDVPRISIHLRVTFPCRQNSDYRLSGDSDDPVSQKRSYRKRLLSQKNLTYLKYRAAGLLRKPDRSDISSLSTTILPIRNFDLVGQGTRKSTLT